MRTNRTTLTGIAVTLLLAGCTAARPWTRSYGGPGSEIGAGIVPAQPDGYYIVGSRTQSVGGEVRAGILLIRTDAAGDVVWEKSVGGDGIDRGQSILRGSDGGLVIGAQTTSFGPGGFDATLIKVAENGDQVWARTYVTPPDELVVVAREMETGGYVLAGNVLDSEDTIADAGAAGYMGADRRSSPYLVRSDADGNPTWTRTFDSGTNTLLSDAVSTPDGGVLMLTTTTYFPRSDDDLHLVKIDADGNEIWSRTWKEGRRYGLGLARAVDGNYLITGTYAPVEDTGLTESDILVIKVDSEGNEIWMRTYGNPEMREMGYGVVGVAGGEFVVVGREKRDLYFAPENIVLLKMTAGGDLLWRREFRTDTHNMIGGFFQRSDGGFVITGSTRVTPGRFDAFLIVTDSDGNAIQAPRAE